MDVEKKIYVYIILGIHNKFPLYPPLYAGRAPTENNFISYARATLICLLFHKILLFDFYIVIAMLIIFNEIILYVCRLST